MTHSTYTIENILDDLNCSPRDLLDFVDGIRAKMGKGLDLREAITAHSETMARDLSLLAANVCKERHTEAAKEFVVSAFFGEAA